MLMRRLAFLLFSLIMASPLAAQVDPVFSGTALLGAPADTVNAAPAVRVDGALPAVVPAPAAPNSATPAADYLGNLRSDVFGAQLFTGRFAREGGTQFNPDYAISVGDRIQVRFWGGFEYDSLLTVDPKGNLFLPHVGPVQVLGVRNQDLQRVMESAVAQVFRANVYSYASLAAAQPVRVFVSGFVSRPGLYDGTSMDSLLHYLDLAGGVDPDRGTFLKIQVKRGDTVRARFSLYDFLLEGRMPLVQLADGDVIFVPGRGNSVSVSGLAQNPRRFEFAGEALPVSELERLARPLAQATHLRITRNSGTVRNVEYYALEEAPGVSLGSGDTVEFTADKKPGTITVRVEGEHLSPQEYVLPYGARMGELLSNIQYSDRSDQESLQLFRKSVQERQKQMLDTALKSLEAAALTARSGTSDEARLRKEEAELLLQWVDRARKIQPLGQVLIAAASSRDDLLLENGDIVKIPVRDGLVLVSGEVLFPNAIAFESAMRIPDYVQGAGGYTQNADAARVVVAHRDGSFEQGGDNGGVFGLATPDPTVRAGDEILVLPKIDVKSRQIWKDLTQIIYQIAVSARVVVDL